MKTTIVMLLGCCLVLAGCSGGGLPGSGLANPPQSIAAAPDYPNMCAPVGADTSLTCLRLTLQAIDAARGREGLRPMVLPSNFPRLSIPEQLFVAINRERADRGLAPFMGLVTALDVHAQQSAEAAQLPPRPGHPYATASTDTGHSTPGASFAEAAIKGYDLRSLPSVVERLESEK